MDKITVPDIRNEVTSGAQGALLVNSIKQRVNDLVDEVNSLGDASKLSTGNSPESVIQKKDLKIATQTEDGLLSKEDKTRIDSLASGAVTSVMGKTGDVILSLDDLGLERINNTSDLEKPISNATQAALNSKVNQTALKQGAFLDLASPSSLIEQSAGDNLVSGDGLSAVLDQFGKYFQTRGVVPSGTDLNTFFNAEDSGFYSVPSTEATVAKGYPQRAVGRDCLLRIYSIPDNFFVIQEVITFEAQPRAYRRVYSIVDSLAGSWAEVLNSSQAGTVNGVISGSPDELAVGSAVLKELLQVIGLFNPSNLVSDLSANIANNRIFRGSSTSIGGIGWAASYLSMRRDSSPIYDLIAIGDTRFAVGKKTGELGTPVWHNILSQRNTSVDSNGFVKSASPVIKLFKNRIEKNGFKEIEAVSFRRVSVGVYELSSCPPLATEGWYLESPKDRNNNIYFTVDWFYDEVNKVLRVETFEPDYSTGKAINGDPVDILDERFISLRFDWVEDEHVNEIPFDDFEGSPTQVIQGVPQQVTMRQAKLALVKIGKYEVIDNFIKSSKNQELKIEWEYGFRVNRNNELIETLAPLMNLTKTDLDNLFILASTL